MATPTGPGWGTLIVFTALAVLVLLVLGRVFGPGLIAWIFAVCTAATAGMRLYRAHKIRKGEWR
jgi:hypothetical protein